MRNVIAVFRVRNEAMQLSSSLKRIGIRHKTINTPRELGEGCSLSIIFLERDIVQIRYMISKNTYSSFKGLFVISGDVYRKYLPI